MSFFHNYKAISTIAKRIPVLTEIFLKLLMSKIMSKNGITII